MLDAVLVGCGGNATQFRVNTISRFAPYTKHKYAFLDRDIFAAYRKNHTFEGANMLLNNLGVFEAYFKLHNIWHLKLASNDAHLVTLQHLVIQAIFWMKLLCRGQLNKCITVWHICHTVYHTLSN